MQQDTNTRWNFAVIILDASFFFGAQAVIEPMAVLPIFLRTLTASTLVIGILITLQQAGWFLPQLLVASRVQHLPRKKPFFVTMALAGRFPCLFLPVLILLLAGPNPNLLLVLMLAIFAVLFFASGTTAVPWQDIVAKSIPATLRGRCLGLIQVVGGILALGAGEIVRRILANPQIAYPSNYTILFSIFGIGLIISGVFLSLIREPASKVSVPEKSFKEMLRMIPGVWKETPLFRRMIQTQILLNLATIAFPFYVVYAQTRLEAPARMAGIFVWAGVAGMILGSAAWGYLSDHFGSSRVIRAVAWVVIANPLAAVLIPLLPVPAPLIYYFYAVVFALMKATITGLWLGFINFVLEMVNEENRPALVGITATLTAPVVLFPFLGGWLLDFLPYEVIFLIAAVGGVLGWRQALKLSEPRQLKAAEVADAS